MGKETFVDIEIKKNSNFLKDVDIEKVSVFNKILLGEKKN